MRQLSPAFIVTSLALAFASNGALAQVSRTGTIAPTTNTATSTTGSATTGTSTTTPTVSSGSCVGSNGSTCSSSTTTAASNSTATSAPSETNGLSGVNVTAPASGSTTPTSTPAGASNSPAAASNPVGTGDGTANGAFRNTPNDAGVTPTGANGMQSGLIVPGAVTLVDASLDANGPRTAASNAGAPNANSNVNQTAAPTPLFELAARQGMAKEAARRARGEEPRVYGIAPRTDRDLTRQMPDDPIIRY